MRYRKKNPGLVRAAASPDAFHRVQFRSAASAQTLHHVSLAEDAFEQFRISAALVRRNPIAYPRPGKMNSHGEDSLLMSVITSISVGAFSVSASVSAPRSPPASVTRQDRTPNAFA